jgi:uncharacterized protein (TIGR02246 family)
MRHAFTVFGLVALLAGLVHAQEDKKAETTKLSPSQQAIRKNAEAFVEAFNKADAKAVAALYTENAQMSVDGETIAEGRAAVEKAYAEYFKENPGTTISVTIDSIKVMGPNIVIEKGASQLTSSDEPVLDAYTMVHVKQDGKWLTATADVAQRAAPPEFDWKQELGFLAGKWIAEEKDWSVETSFEWVAGGNFLKRSFEVTNGEQVESSGVQVIGWDPLEGAVTSWIFGSDGGHGRGWWLRDGEHWVIQSEGTTASGEILRATNVMTLLGKDEFRWQSTNRSLNGVALENTPSVRVRRVKAEN